MTTEEIYKLLEKYWENDTSLVEESDLKTFFSRNSIPEELKKYQALFLWKTNQLQLRSDKTLKTGFNKPVRFQLYSVLKIAASVLLALTLGIGFYTHYQQEKFLDKTFSETYSNPEDALQETKNVIGKISSVLNMAKDKRIEAQMLDSLEQTGINNRIE
jgi:predicted DNA-binding protein YlxM (UPF0122 family)